MYDTSPQYLVPVIYCPHWKGEMALEHRLAYISCSPEVPTITVRSLALLVFSSTAMVP